MNNRVIILCGVEQFLRLIWSEKYILTKFVCLFKFGSKLTVLAAFACVLYALPSSAAVTTDNNNGVWFDDYNDATGIATTSNTLLDPGAITLSACDGSVASGEFTTSIITPAGLSGWGQLTATGLFDPTTISFEVRRPGAGILVSGSGPVLDLSAIDSVAEPALEVRVILTYSASLPCPRLSSLELSWVPKSTLLLAKSTSETRQAGELVIYRIEASVSFVDATDLVVYDTLPSLAEGTITQPQDFGQDDSPTFVSATAGGIYTAGATTILGVSIPANSVYWILPSPAPAGTTYSLRFSVRSLNGSLDGTFFENEAFADASNSELVTSPVAITTLIQSTPHPTIDKQAGNGIHEIDGALYALLDSTIEYRVSGGSLGINANNQIGDQTMYESVVYDDVSEMCALVTCPGAISGISDAGVFDPAFVPPSGGTAFPAIVWDNSGADYTFTPGSQEYFNYFVDITGVADGAVIDNTVCVDSATSDEVCDVLQINVGIDSSPSGVFAKGDDLDSSFTASAGTNDDALLSGNYGTTYDYLLAATNQGGSKLNDVVMADMIPSGTAFVSASLPSIYTTTSLDIDGDADTETALIFYSTSGAFTDPSVPPPVDEVNARDGDLDVAGNTFWQRYDISPPADPSLVTWVAFYLPQIGSSVLPPAVPSSNVTFGVITVAADIPANTCVPTTIDNRGVFSYASYTDLSDTLISVTPTIILDDEVTELKGKIAELQVQTVEADPQVLEAPNVTQILVTVTNSDSSSSDTSIDTTVTLSWQQVLIDGVFVYPGFVNASGGSVDLSQLATGQVSVNVGTLLPGQSAVVTIDLFIPEGARDGDVLAVLSSVNASDDGGCDVPANVRSITVPIISTPKLSVFKESIPSLILPNGSYRYDFTYDNLGPGISTETYVVDRIPEEIEFVDADLPNGERLWCSNSAELPSALTPFSPLSSEDITRLFVLGTNTAGNTWVCPAGLTPPRWIAIAVDDTALLPVQLTSGAAPQTFGINVLDLGSAIGEQIINFTAILSTQALQAIAPQALTLVSDAPALNVEKRGPIEVTSSAQVSWTLEFINTSTANLTTVTLTDDMPPNSTFVSASLDWNAQAVANGAPAGSINITGDVIVAGPQLTIPISPTLRGGDLLTTEGGTITLVTQLDGTLPSGTQLLNNVCATGQSGVTPIPPVCDIHQITVQNPELFLSKQASRPDPAAGDIVTYTLIVSNQNGVDAPNVVLTDTLPAGLSYVASSVTVQFPLAYSIGEPDVAGGVLTWSAGFANALTNTITGLDTLPGDSGDIVISYDVLVGAVPPDTTLVNQAGISTSAVEDGVYASANCGGPVGNIGFQNEDCATIRTPFPDPQVIKSGPVTADPGESATWSILYSNANNEAAADVYLIDSLPDNDSNGADVTFVTTSGSRPDGVGGTESIPQSDIYYHDAIGVAPVFDPLSPLSNGWSATPTSPVSHVAYIIGTLEAESPVYNISLTATMIDPVLGGDLPAGQRYQNQVTIFSSTADDDPSNNTDDHEVPTPGIDMAVTKTGSIEGVFPGTYPGASLIYTLRYANNGNQVAYGVRVEDELPALVNFDSDDFNLVFLSTEQGGACTPVDIAGSPITSPPAVTRSIASQTVTWNVGGAGYQAVGIPPGCFGEFQVFATIDPATPEGTSLDNRVRLFTDNRIGDPAPSDPDSDPFACNENFCNNNEDFSSVSVFLADVVVYKSVVDTATNSDSITDQGSSLTYTIEYENIGNIDAQDTIINEIIPAGSCFETDSISGLPTGLSAIEYSNNNGVDYTYSPNPGIDCAVTNFRILLGVLPAPSNFDGEDLGFSGVRTNAPLIREHWPENENVALGLEIDAINISETMPVGEGTGSSSQMSQAYSPIASDGTDVYVLYLASTTGSGFGSDAYLYNSGTGVSTNLSALMRLVDPTETLGSVGFSDQLERVAINSLGDVYAIWSENNTNGDGEDLYLYDGSTGTVTDISDTLPIKANVRDIWMDFKPTGEPIVVWGEGSTFSHDAFFYDHSTGTSTDLTALAPLTFNSFFPATKSTSIASDSLGNPHIVWAEGNGPRGNADLFYYDGVAVTDLSNLLPVGEGGSSAFQPGVAVDGNDNVYISWGEATGARGGPDVYLYSRPFGIPASSGTIINLSDMSPPGTDTSPASTNHPRILISSSDIVYVVFLLNSGTIGTSDIAVYDSSTGAITVVTELLPAGQGTSVDDYTDVIIRQDEMFISNDTDQPVIGFTALSEPAAGNDDAFVYDYATGTITNMTVISPVQQGGVSLPPKIVQGAAGNVFSLTQVRGNPYSVIYDASTGELNHFGDHLDTNVTGGSDGIVVGPTGLPWTIYTHTGTRGSSDLYLYQGLLKPTASYDRVINADPSILAWGNLLVEDEVPSGTQLLYSVLDATCTTPFSGLDSVVIANGFLDVSSIPAGTADVCLRVEFFADAARLKTPVLDAWYMTYFAPGARPSFTFRTEVVSPYVGNGEIFNTADISTTTPETDYSNNDDDDSIFIRISNVTAEKTVDLLAGAAGDTLVYTINYSNEGPQDAQNWSLTDSLPSLLNAPSSIIASTTSAGNTVDCQYDGNVNQILCGKSVAESAETGLFLAYDIFSNELHFSSATDRTTILSTVFLTRDDAAPVGVLYGAAHDPNTNTHYVATSTAFGAIRELGTVDITTGVISIIGPINSGGVNVLVSELAFDSNTNTLYALAGDGDPNDPSDLFTVNLATAAATEVADYTNNFDGEGLAFNPDNNLLYRLSGDELWEIDPLSPTTPVFLSITTDFTLDTTALTHLPLGGDPLLMTYFSNTRTVSFTAATFSPSLPNDVGGMYFLPGFQASGDLLAGESGTITITADISPTAVSGDLLTNSVCAQTSSVESSSADNCGEAQTTINTLANVFIQKSGPDGGLLEDTLIYNLNYGNNGNLDAAAVQVSDTLPTGCVYDASNTTPLPTTVVSQVLTWDFTTQAIGTPAGTLRAGPGGGLDAGTIQVACIVNNDLNLVGTTLTNFASISTTTAEVTSADNQDAHSTPIDIGLASITGFVFMDVNEDVIKDITETPISDVTITLTGTDVFGSPVSLTTVTNVNGGYSFPGLFPGTYTLTETQPADVDSTGSAVGTGASGAVGSSNGSDQIVGVTLNAGDTAIDYNFGEIAPFFLDLDYGDAPANYFTSDEVDAPRHRLLNFNPVLNSADMMLGLTVDDEINGQPTTGADGDNTADVDDEDGVATFPRYESTGGTVCGSYVTLANEYCVSVSLSNDAALTSQLVAWIDFDTSGTFGDSAYERSIADLGGTGAGVLVGDGTYGTGNIAASSGVQNRVLVWQGLPDTPAGEGQNVYARFRLTSQGCNGETLEAGEIDFCSDTSPQPISSASDGEIEDYVFPFNPPLVNISGNVFNDTDALTNTNNTVDGTGTNLGSSLFATLLDASGTTVIAVAPIAADGSYSFAGVTPYTSYIMQLSTLDETAQIGSAPSASASLPAGWVNTGEYVGLGAGTDTPIDGLLPFDVLGADLNEINFGVATTSCIATATGTGVTEAFYALEGNTNDASGNGNNPTNVPNVTYSGDAVQGTSSAQYNGAPIIMDLPIGNDAFFNKILSMSIKPSNLSTQQVLMDEGDATNGILLELTASGDIQLTVVQLGVQTIISAAFPTDGLWHSVGYNFASTNTLSLYLDGASVDTTTLSDPELASHASGLSLFDRNGFSADGSNASNPYTGLMDDVRVIIDSETLLEFNLCEMGNMSCTTDSYMAQGATSLWNTLNVFSGESVVTDDDVDFQINAIGYNVIDNRIWGYYRGGLDGRLTVTVKNPDGSFTTALTDPITGLPTLDYVVGDVDVNGVLFLTSDTLTSIEKVDVNPSSPTYLQYLGTSPFPACDCSDFAFNPVDGFLYWVTDGTGNLQRMDPNTGVVTDLGASGAPPELTLGYGAQFFDADGFMYAYNNLTGETFRLSLGTDPGSDYDETQTVLFSTSVGGLTLNDGAACPTASEVVDYSDAPDSYGTSLTTDGPRHLISNHNITNQTSDLMMGAAINREFDGLPANPGADPVGDEDDAFTGVLPLLVGTSTVYDLSNIPVVNTTGTTATLSAWIDFDDNGTFDAGEIATTTVADGATTASLSWSGYTVAATSNIYMRLRLTTDASVILPTGFAPDGEVEDYVLSASPTAVTIGDVSIAAVSLADYFAEFGIGGMSRAQLWEILAVWDPERAESLRAASAEEIFQALENYLDFDGDGQVAVFRWDTLEERGTIGFYVDRRQSQAAWTRLNDDLLPGLISSPLGATYQLVDRFAVTGETYHYRLTELEARGSTRVYGPFTLTMP